MYLWQSPTNDVDDDDDNWDEIEQEGKKNSLEATSLISHSVHCPYFPSDKQVIKYHTGVIP